MVMKFLRRILQTLRNMKKHFMQKGPLFHPTVQFLFYKLTTEYTKWDRLEKLRIVICDTMLDILVMYWKQQYWNTLMSSKENVSERTNLLTLRRHQSGNKIFLVKNSMFIFKEKTRSLYKTFPIKLGYGVVRSFVISNTITSCFQT